MQRELAEYVMAKGMDEASVKQLMRTRAKDYVDSIADEMKVHIT